MDERLFLLAFPVLFAGTWLAVTYVIGRQTGWFRLMEKYPDQPGDVIARHLWQSAVMGTGPFGGVNLNNILNLTVCPNGLRLGVMKVFGLFQRDVFIPWSEIRIERRKYWWMKMAQLTFGEPPVGRLMLRAKLADQLAGESQGFWPERGPPTVSHG